MQTRSRVFWTVAIAMLSTMGYLLMMLDFPLPGFPSYLKIDLSEIPVLLGAIVFGPVAGIVIEALKNFLHYVTQGSPAGVPVGELANFVAGLLFVLPVAFISRKMRSTKGLTGGLLIGVFLMALVMAVLNYFIILPMYMWFLNFPHMSSATMFDLVLVFIMPFNLIKGILTAVIFFLLYPKLKPIVNRLNPGNRLNMV